jgi:heme exporter protein D
MLAFMDLDAAIWVVLAIAVLSLVVYAFHATRTHRMLARQFEDQQKFFENQQKALDRQTEAMERIAAALEIPKR